MSLVKKTPKPQMMALYYAKLTQIFWMSESHLYHAYAWYRLYTLQKSYNKNLKEKDLQLMASSVLLATLAIPPYDKRHGAAQYEIEMEKERNVRMASLLCFTVDARRGGDSKELVWGNHCWPGTCVSLSLVPVFGAGMSEWGLPVPLHYVRCDVGHLFLSVSSHN